MRMDRQTDGRHEELNQHEANTGSGATHLQALGVQAPPLDLQLSELHEFGLNEFDLRNESHMQLKPAGRAMG